MKAKRLTQWIWWHQDNWPDSALYEYARRAVARIECALRGHKPERDQCGRHEHDHCLWCDRPMPGQAPPRRGSA